MRVVVTGANRGIGLGLVRELMAGDHEVWATCRNPTEAAALSALSPAGIVSLDLSDPASIEACAGELSKQVNAVDLLINNAGIAWDMSRPLPSTRRDYMSTTPEAMFELFRVNTVGPYVFTKALLPLLVAAGGSTVCNITSQLGSIQVATAAITPAARTRDWYADYAYCVSKAGLNMLTAMLARELEPAGVRAIAVHPGWVRTDGGGADAAIAVEESAAGIVHVLTTGATANPPSAVINRRGETIPW